MTGRAIGGHAIRQHNCIETMIIGTGDRAEDTHIGGHPCDQQMADAVGAQDLIQLSIVSSKRLGV